MFARLAAFCLGSTLALATGSAAAQAEQPRRIATLAPDGSLAAEMEAKAESMWGRWVGKLYSARELELVVKYRAEYRAKNPVTATQ